MTSNLNELLRLEGFIPDQRLGFIITVTLIKSLLRHFLRSHFISNTSFEVFLNHNIPIIVSALILDFPSPNCTLVLLIVHLLLRQGTSQLLLWPWQGLFGIWKSGAIVWGSPLPLLRGTESEVSEWVVRRVS